MAKQKRKITASFVAVMLLISVILSGCGQKPQDVPADADVSSVVESSEVESTEESQAEEAQPQPTEEPASTEEPEVTLSGTYLFEMEQGDNLEFKYSDYNSDYKVGNRITISVEMESAGAFNGCLGTNVGSNYDWQQEDYDSQAGSYTLTWTVTPSLDQAQLSVWYTENAPVGIVSIDVTIEEVEPAVIGKLATFTEQDTFEFTFSEYNSEYKVGDLVKISVVMESDGDFNGSIGASVGRDYAWNQKEFRYEEGGKYTLTWTVKPSSDYSNIGIWWVGGTSVGIHSVTVTVLEEEIGIHGDYITMFTDEGNYEFIPSVINPNFKFGDKIRVKVTLESDGEFTGSLGTCVGNNYEWTQVECESDTGVSTWVMDVSPVIDSIQIGVWYIGGTAVGIQNIEIDILYWGYQHRTVKGLIYTATQNNETYTFKPSDYCDFEDGDIITIKVELDSNDVYNGSMGVNDIDGVYRSKTYSSNGGGVTCELVVKGSTKEEAKIDFWWMNTRVALNSITVTKGGTIVDTNDDDTFYPGEQTKYRSASDYCDYSAGDTLTVAVTLSSDGYFNGALGMSSSIAGWVQSDYESADGSPVTCVLKVPGAYFEPKNIQINVWWSEGSYVKIDKITVTKDSSGGNEDDNKPVEGEKIDTSNWQLAFNGFTSNWDGWNSVNGDAGKLEYSTIVADIMAANNITSIDDFGGFIFQIWHVDSKYNDKTYTYRLDINGTTYKEGEGTINTNDYNSTDVIRLTMEDYTFSPKDKITGVITVSEDGEQQPEDPSSVTTIFKDGKTGESYESSDASWLVNAADDAVITIVYTCDNAGNAGWGVLGWGASVNGEWINGPIYDADRINAAKELTIKTIAGKLRSALGIETGSEVTAIKLDAWNGGRIISLTIAESSGTEEPDTGIYTFTYDEWKKIQDNNQATGNSDSYSFTFNPSDYAEFIDGDTINVSVTLDSDNNYFNGKLGANDLDWSWIESGDLDSSQGLWSLTIPNAGIDRQVQIQINWMNPETTSVKVTKIEVQKEGTTEEPDTNIHTFTYDEWKKIQDNNQATGSSDSYSFAFNPADYAEFVDGDTINVSVTLDSDSNYFNGKLGANDLDWGWVDSGDLDSSQSLWTLTIPNAGIDRQVQIQINWMNPETTSVKVTKIEVQKEGTTEEPDTDIHTFTYDEWKKIQDNNQATGSSDSYSFAFNPVDYAEFVDGDTINVSVTLDSDSNYFNGKLGANDLDWGWVDSGDLDSSQSLWTLTIPNAGIDRQVQIQINWMNPETTSVKVTKIEVQKEGTTEEPDTDIHTFTYDEWKKIQDNNQATGNSDSYSFAFNPADYAEFVDGDTINVSVTLDSDSNYFNGKLGANDLDWGWVDSSDLDSSQSLWTLTIPNAGIDRQVQIQVNWMNPETTSVKVTKIEVTTESATSIANFEESVTEVTKSNALILFGTPIKNTRPLPDSDNVDATSVSGNESVSGNNSTTAVSGNDAEGE